MHCGLSDRERVRHNGSNSCISQFWMAVTNVTQIYRWSEKFLYFIRPQYLISPHYLSGHNSYTHLPSTDINDFNSQSPMFIYDTEGQSFRISLRNLQVKIFNTSLPLPSDIPIYY
jgi:hypothetical protein